MCIVTRYGEKFKKAAFAAYNILSACFGLLFCVFAINNAVFAQEMGSSEIRIMFIVFKDMSDLFIKFAYGAMLLIFAVGMVKSGLTAQAAKQFGMPGRVSSEAINVIGGIVVFVFGILAFPMARVIISKVTSETGVSSAPTTNNLHLPGL